jgi:DNA transformation protein
MFGGHGLYRNGKMFAIVVEGELFFKVTEATRADFEERGLQPFTYDRKGKRVALSYYQAPPECLDDSRPMVDWAKKSLLQVDHR